MAKFLPAIRGKTQPVYDAARANPKDAYANGKLRMLLAAHEQYESAAFCYERARLLGAGSFRWPYYLGSVLALQGRNNDAVSALREALKADADYARAPLKLAEALLSIGKLGRASSSANVFRQLGA
jgi:tetratricopeptide (TPR) repeat protein